MLWSPVTDFLKHKFIAAFVAEAKYQAHQDVSSSQCPALVKALKLSRERERETWTFEWGGDFKFGS